MHHASDQCAWIKEYCQDDDVGLVSYLSLYYCKMPQLKAVAFTLIAIWSGLLFATIGVAASDFFCVNLSTIADLFGMSESLAGVTFLAFGNGSPDVFSTFAAVRSNSGSLAVGELIGAAGFITAVVSGSMALVRPFKVARRSFLRDVGFFIVAIAFSMIFVANGKLELWECATMVGFYVFYVIVVVVWHWWLEQRRKRREQHAIARGYFVDPLAGGEIDFEEQYHDDEEQGALRRGSIAHPSDVDFSNLEHLHEEQDDFDELEEETERDKWMGELSSNMRLSGTPIGERRNIFNPIRPSLVGALEFQSVLHGLRKSMNITSYPVRLRRFSDGPVHTLATQRSKAHSTTSDPQTVSLNTSREPSPARSYEQSQEGFHGRGRARSANAADMLGLSPSTWHHRQRSRSNLSSLRANSSRSRLSDHDSLPVPSQGHSRQASPQPSVQGSPMVDTPRQPSPPLVLVEPPAEERTREPSPAGRPRASTMDLLAPPNPHQPNQRSDAFTKLDGIDIKSRDKPQLRITPPTPHLATEYFPSLGSPPKSDSARSPRPQNVLFQDTIPSPESMYPSTSHSDTQSKPLHWWPYDVFVPPTTIYRTLFPTIHMWREKNWLGKFAGVVSTPCFFFLTITLPVVEPEAMEPDQINAPPMSPPAVDASEPPSVLQGSTVSSSGPGPGPDDLAHVAIAAGTRHHPTVNDAPSPTAPQNHYNAHVLPLVEQHPHAVVHSPREWNRWLVLLQCFTAPYFVVLATWANFFDAEPRALLMPSIYCVIGSSITLVASLLTTHSDHPPRWHFMLCFAGFAVGVTWISSIANEVVGVLKAIGVIFNISDAILGLTIFAVGNSMGDLVADITVARLGYPVMALSACFGGPMLNILLGVGLSGLYMVIHKADHRHHQHPDEELRFKPYRVEVSTTLMISAVALLVTLVGLLIAVPLNKWTMDRKIGIGLMVLWVVATAGNLGVELSGIAQAYS